MVKKRPARRVSRDGASEEAPKSSSTVLAVSTPASKPAVLRNKTKVLVTTTRGITTRFRHFLTDLLRLLPHAKKEPKMDAKDRLTLATEMAELRGCDRVLLLEARKRQDLYLWLGGAPDGPTFKFHVANVHTMDELAFPGNNLMFSRPLLTFDPAFDASPHMRLAKEMLAQVFAAPEGHRRTKPFVDHVLAFYVVDGRVWMRHYQIVDAALDDKTQNKDVESTVVEIGPRLVMTPIKCFSGSFAGATIWENDKYVSPNEMRRAVKLQAATKGISKQARHAKRQRHIAKNAPKPNPLASVFK